MACATAAPPSPTPTPLHLLVFPFPAQGHILPLLDLLDHLSHRHPSIFFTVILTPKNSHLLPQSAAPTIQKLVLPLPPHPSLPAGAENIKDLASAAYYPFFAHSLCSLHSPILLWSRSQPRPPTALLSDFILGGNHRLAADLGVPHLVFFSTSAILASVLHHIWRDGDILVGSDGAVTFPRIPGSPSWPFPHIPSMYRRFRKGVFEWEALKEGLIANSSSWGVVMNTFDGIDGVYLKHLKAEFGHDRVWAVGPIRPTTTHARGGPTSVPAEEVFGWLNSCPEKSVVYVCFGSQFLPPPAMEAVLEAGLERSGVRFVWVVRGPAAGGGGGEVLERRAEGRGLVVRGWAPQVALLSHATVGAFLTHCGWNSVLEGMMAGKVLLTWPVEADQFLNARLLVEELGVGVKAWEGCDSLPDPGELGRVVADSVQAHGGDLLAVRERAAEMERKAKESVGKGGSSDREIEKMIAELWGVNATQ